MNEKFLEIINTFPARIERINNSPFVTKDDFKHLPKKGIYVFYENGKPIYVGRSKNLRQRFRQHRHQSSGHNSATFAFMIARLDAEKEGVNIKRTREELQNDPVFSPIFSKTKTRVSEMQIQVLPMDDPIEQTLFEVYAALELNTEYNNWETH
jgi:predicted GIY-YIG superfamily endonuclease